jgi:predicted ATPase
MKRLQVARFETPRLKSVKLERFKAAFKPDPIELQPFTFVIGRNGSGKSTLLEALQWLDVTLRFDAVHASDRYAGVHDLINIRGRGENTKYFRLDLVWVAVDGQELEYSVRVNESEDRRPLVHSEELKASGRGELLVTTNRSGTRIRAGERKVYPNDKDRSRIFDEPDRLALSVVGRTAEERGRVKEPLDGLRDFWRRAVFLRLSPNRLASGSPPHRRSFEPLLDEEGQMLPALLSELNHDQKGALIEAIQSVLPDVKDVRVSETNASHEQNVVWSIKERMPTGYAGKGTYEIPASMLSEGTRRLTAIFALLKRDPPPSLLCIEEIENGLDPWTVIKVLSYLRSAADGGTQIILTSHSPWVLDNANLSDILYVTRKQGNTRYQRFRDSQAVKNFMASVPPGARYVNLDE